MNLRAPTSPCQRLVSVVSWLALAAALPAAHTIRVTVADGFDLPVGKPNGEGYYVYRGYMPNAHQGEDWNGSGGGNSDLGDPVYAAADGVVVYSEDYRRSWGNLVIVRHAYRSTDGSIQIADSLYAHLDKRTVRLYQLVKRGQQVGTIGTAHGLYAAHLHFEVRKNLRIGPFQRAFARDYSNYFSPRQFISQRRQLKGGDNAVVPVDTFAGQADTATTAKTSAPPSDPGRREIPVRVPKDDARVAEAARVKREEDLKKLVEEHRRKVAAMKEEDMDAFWNRVRSKLGKKK
jgi:murein DD-endopeptidase MepM/ murein hydrolase activator NlpD